MTSTVGIVTVTFNSETVIDDFLMSAWASTGVDVRVYAIDNCSTDGTVARIDAFRARFPEFDVRLVSLPFNFGVAYANNEGILAALGDGCQWICLANNDTFWEPEELRRLVEQQESMGTRVLSPSIYATEPQKSVYFVGGRIHAGRGTLAKHDHWGEPMEALGRTGVWRTDYAPTCFLLFHPSVFCDVGLMDESYFVYGDDVDFALRCLRSGIGYYVTASARITHKASSLTGGAYSDFSVFWLSRNWLLVHLRHQRGVKLFTGLLYQQGQVWYRFLRRLDNPGHFFLRQKAFAAAARFAARNRTSRPAHNLREWIETRDGRGKRVLMSTGAIQNE